MSEGSLGSKNETHFKFYRLHARCALVFSRLELSHPNIRPGTGPSTDTGREFCITVAHEFYSSLLHSYSASDSPYIFERVTSQIPRSLLIVLLDHRYLKFVPFLVFQRDTLNSVYYHTSQFFQLLPFSLGHIRFLNAIQI